ncbi:torsin-4A isoform B [Alligator mississippiensis]|uniref:Torsin-4A isoform B n=1 Tax=Alligator mississippiensis TaxID=8496 RepID=A0A151MEQ1_ALLMI|nr:torsin-4A isoform B [Alligator mississippiensis]
MQLLWMPPVRPRRRRDVRRQSEWFREGSNMDGEPPCPKPPTLPHKISLVSSPMRAVIRLRRKVRIQKKNCLQVDLNKDKSPELVQTRLLQRQISLNRTNLCSSSISLFNQSSFENSRYFTFDTSRDQCTLNKYKRKKRRRKSKILNAIENLDDNLQKYDLDGLEKTMHREVFGQKLAVEKIMELLKDYLATHIHNKPLVISLNGPTGVGKSHVGWLLAKHFRSVMDSDFVLQYFVMHHCPNKEATLGCQLDLSKKISDIVTRAETEEKIPLFILDEVEHIPPVLLDTLSRFFEPNQTNEFLNAIYILISNIGDSEITKTNWTIQSQVIIILVAVQRCCTMTTERWETAGQLSPKTCPRLSQPCMGSVEPV